LAKYAVYTKWYWPEGVIGSNELSDHMKKNVPNNHPFDDILWWQIDEHHHQSVAIYSSEQVAAAYREKVLAYRENENNTGCSMVEETMGPVLSQLTDIKPKTSRAYTQIREELLSKLTVVRPST
tara:strand:+ start:295 stop:666 length:372 start_codon:yes stop_codon:yes gene_type:complete